MNKEDVLRRIAEALGIDEPEESNECATLQSLRRLTVQVGMERLAMFWIPQDESHITAADLESLRIIITGAFLEADDAPAVPLSAESREDLEAICHGITLDAQTSDTPDTTLISRVLAELHAELGEPVH